MVKLFSRFNDKPAVAAHAPRPSVERQQPIGPLSEAQWLRLRRPESGADGVLAAATLEWLNALPEHVRPVELARRHARLANRICICWSEPPLLDQVMVRGVVTGLPKASACWALIVTGCPATGAVLLAVTW